jgi:hypothetical protein
MLAAAICWATLADVDYSRLALRRRIVFPGTLPKQNRDAKQMLS